MANHNLLHVYIRGGWDALTLCVPLEEAGYDANRDLTRVFSPEHPTAPPEKKAKRITPAIYDGAGNLVRTSFGLPPAFQGVAPLYRVEKNLCFIQGVGSLDETRSHFSQQKHTELGTTTESDIQAPEIEGLGWLGRYLNSTPTQGDATLRALAISPFTIASFAGGTGVTPTLSPDAFGIPFNATLMPEIQSVYAEATANPVNAGLANDVGAISKLESVNWGSTSGYPPTILGNQFRQAFEVFRDLPEVEVVSIDYDNIAGQRWDTHNQQGVFEGTMANLMNDLASALTAFMDDTKDLPSDQTVTVMIYSEFGRTLHENCGAGTDHGRGGLALLVGDRVQGGQVYTPTESQLQLSVGPWPTGFSDDLPVLIDIRDIQSEVAEKCMGADVSKVFPDANYTPKDHGLIV